MALARNVFPVPGGALEQDAPAGVPPQDLAEGGVAQEHVEAPHHFVHRPVQPLDVGQAHLDVLGPDRDVGRPAGHDHGDHQDQAQQDDQDDAGKPRDGVRAETRATEGVVGQRAVQQESGHGTEQQAGPEETAPTGALPDPADVRQTRPHELGIAEGGDHLVRLVQLRTQCTRLSVAQAAGTGGRSGGARTGSLVHRGRHTIHPPFAGARGRLWYVPCCAARPLH